jgi:hypothetical protein
LSTIAQIRERLGDLQEALSLPSTPPVTSLWGQLGDGPPTEQNPHAGFHQMAMGVT